MKSMKHLITTDDLSDEEVAAVFNLAKGYLKHKDSKLLVGKSLINLFFEESTRTRSSFEIAAKNLGAEVVNINVAKSALKKGETEVDTIKTLSAMHPSFITIRHGASGAVQSLARHSKAIVLNSGDGAHAHPTQAFLDCFTILQRKGKISGLKVAICGDIINSRVARSNIRLLSRLGAEVRLVGPETLLPKHIDGVSRYTNIYEGVAGADVIITLRLQRERMISCFVPSASEYYKFYGISQKVVDSAKDDVIVLHPGPMNRNVEIADSIADDRERCAVLDQVRNGIAVRQAVLEVLVKANS